MRGETEDTELKLVVWILLPGPLHPPLNIAENFGGAYTSQALCEHSIVELLKAHPELPGAYYHCMRTEVIGEKPRS